MQERYSICSHKIIAMKKCLLAACLLVLTVFTVHAQEEDAPKKGFDKEKLFFGGNFGLGFGSYQTIVNVSPQVGYRFNQYLAAGVGVNFIYSSYRQRFEPSTYDYKESYGVTGLNIFGRVYPLEFFLLQIQPEMNYTWGKIKYYDGSPDQKLDAKFVPSLVGGAGAVIPAGRGSFLLMVQYDLLQNERSPYGNRAFYNFGYNIGF